MKTNDYKMWLIAYVAISVVRFKAFFIDKSLINLVIALFFYSMTVLLIIAITKTKEEK